MEDHESYSKGKILAGSVLSITLLDVLFDKGLLTLSESRDALLKASRACGELDDRPERNRSFDILSELLKGKYSAIPNEEGRT